MSQHSSRAVTVGRRIAAERRRAGLSRAAMAARLGWSQGIYNHDECSRRAPQLDPLAAIADVLGVPLAALLTEDERVAAMVTHLARRPDLVSEVAFFLAALDQELSVPDDHAP